MAPVPKNTKLHFTHPNHPLVYLSDDQDYNCDGCKTSGSGGRFRCHACDFDLHEYCANCPDKLSSFIHQHQLALVVRKAESTRLNDRICDVCLDSVTGLFYRCKDCDFDVHPLCTQLPKELRHVIDDKHTLKLQKLSFGSCVVCKTDCSSLWVYGCEVCRVNIHLDCLLEPYDSPANQWSETPVPPPSQERSSSRSRGIPFAAPPWSTGPPPFTTDNYAWYGGYPGGPFPHGFDACGNPNVFGNYGLGSHTYGYAAPYGVPDYSFGYPFGFPHGSGYSYVNHHQACQAGNAAPPPSSSGGKPGKSMFSLVGKLTLGVMSSLIFGTSIPF